MFPSEKPRRRAADRGLIPGGEPIRSARSCAPPRSVLTAKASSSILVGRRRHARRFRWLNLSAAFRGSGAAGKPTYQRPRSRPSTREPRAARSRSRLGVGQTSPAQYGWYQIAGTAAVAEKRHLRGGGERLSRGRGPAHHPPQGERQADGERDHGSRADGTPAAGPRSHPHQTGPFAQGQVALNACSARSLAQSREGTPPIASPGSFRCL